jgi:signal transduction histidine kinase
MLKLLIVDALDERRAEVIDALCELPGIEVRGAVADVTQALSIIDRVRFDVVIGASDLPCATIVSLIDGARRRGVTDIMVLAARTPLLPGMVEYWRDLGAREVINSVPGLIACASAVADVRQRERNQRHALGAQLAAPQPAHSSSGLTLVSTATRAAAVISAAQPQPHRTPQNVSLAEVLREAIPRWGNLIPPEVQLVLEATNDVPRVQCVARDIELLALHLVLDACSALPLGGTIWLCVEREGTAYVRIEVLDSSGRSRSPAMNTDIIDAIARRYSGEVRTVELGGGAVSRKVTLPAVVQLAS